MRCSQGLGTTGYRYCWCCFDQAPTRQNKESPIVTRKRKPSWLGVLLWLRTSNPIKKRGTTMTETLANSPFANVSLNQMYMDSRTVVPERQTTGRFTAESFFHVHGACAMSCVDHDAFNYHCNKCNKYDISMLGRGNRSKLQTKRSKQRLPANLD